MLCWAMVLEWVWATLKIVITHLNQLQYVFPFIFDFYNFISLFRLDSTIFNFSFMHFDSCDYLHVFNSITFLKNNFLK